MEQASSDTTNIFGKGQLQALTEAKKELELQRAQMESAGQASHAAQDAWSKKRIEMRLSIINREDLSTLEKASALVTLGEAKISTSAEALVERARHLHELLIEVDAALRVPGAPILYRRHTHRLQLLSSAGQGLRLQVSDDRDEGYMHGFSTIIMHNGKEESLLLYTDTVEHMLTDNKVDPREIYINMTSSWGIRSPMIVGRHVFEYIEEVGLNDGFGLNSDRVSDLVKDAFYAGIPIAPESSPRLAEIVVQKHDEMLEKLVKRIIDDALKLAVEYDEDELDSNPIITVEHQAFGITLEEVQTLVEQKCNEKTQAVRAYIGRLSVDTFRPKVVN